MSEWFQKAFGEDYLTLYAHRDDSEAIRAVDLILAETGLPKGSLALDAPCGAGRHLRAFHARGIRAYGFDLSLALLKEARAGGIPAESIQRADLRAMPYRNNQFDLVVNLFSSLGYFATDEINLAVLCALVNLTRPGGWVVIDFMNSDYITANLQEESTRETANGIRIHDCREIVGTPPRVNKHTIVTFPDGRKKTFDESVRLFTPEELQNALDNCGVKVEKHYGEYTGASFNKDSKRIILMGRRQ